MSQVGASIRFESKLAKDWMFRLGGAFEATGRQAGAGNCSRQRIVLTKTEIIDIHFR
jgi:hypothetical protein